MLIMGVTGPRHHLQAKASREFRDRLGLGSWLAAALVGWGVALKVCGDSLAADLEVLGDLDLLPALPAEAVRLVEALPVCNVGDGGLLLVGALATERHAGAGRQLAGERLDGDDDVRGKRPEGDLRGARPRGPRGASRRTACAKWTPLAVACQAGRRSWS